ncbi:hypothetical protein [Thioalkalivibrio versutus]|uniref:hypothetical protein n=1 Tax=Thioalkalivibrio versutus TaxID=106634 RepID=UPI00117DC689|nr:hypothetical protein [Thioalkalivibrio versutus]
MGCAEQPPVVAFHVQAGSRVGMGHLARTSSVIKTLSLLGVETVLHLDADRLGYQEARFRGLSPVETLPELPSVLVIDAVEVDSDLAKQIQQYEMRVLISPVFNHPELASHILVRNNPEWLDANNLPETKVVVDPDYSFATAYGLQISGQDYKTLRVGVCLSGGDDDLDLEQIIDAIARAPLVSEIRLIDRRTPAKSSYHGVTVSHQTPDREPWRYFQHINIFVGGDGVMLSEAVAQGIPALSLTTPALSYKNHALMDGGALRNISRSPFESRKLIRILSDRYVAQRMHESALSLHGVERSDKLAKHIIQIVRGM